jgi:hypothetical protein
MATHRVATYVTSYRKAYVWEGKSFRQTGACVVKPEDLAGKPAFDKSADARIFVWRFTPKFTSRNVCG